MEIIYAIHKPPEPGFYRKSLFNKAYFIVKALSINYHLLQFFLLAASQLGKKDSL